MSDISIMEKPEEVSWETVRDVLRQAHQEHIDAGLVMYTTTLTAEEMEARIARHSGQCYVAMEDGQVVGTQSFMCRKRNRWYHHGPCAELTMLGVLPAFRGRHIATDLTRTIEEEIRRRNIGAIIFDTPEQNRIKIKMALKDQYRFVDYHYNNGHYSVVMMKWLDKCPFSKVYGALKYHYKKAKVRLRHTLRPHEEIIR